MESESEDPKRPKEFCAPQSSWNESTAEQQDDAARPSLASASNQIEAQSNRDPTEDSTSQAHSRVAAHLGSPNWSPAIIRNKITNRSQSSPSSLTTHKFGLKPTPSPPRLIIDHNTGDIIESYPERPTYLRTYQPISTEDEDEDDEGEGDNEGDNDNDDDENQVDFDDSLSQPIEQRQPSELDQYCALLARDMNDQTNSARSRSTSGRPLIPPPHSQSGAKVYFAPPEPTGGAGHLFYGRHPQAASNYEPAGDERDDADCSGPNRARLAGSRSTGAHNNSFKRALNKLNDSMAQQMDIAIVTDGCCEPFPATKSRQTIITSASPSLVQGKSSAAPHSAQFGPQNGALVGERQRQLSKQRHANLGKQTSKQQQQQHQQHQPLMYPYPYPYPYSHPHLHPHLQLQHQLPLQATNRKLPMIEDFSLYNLDFIFRVLLVLSISSFIIYLLVRPLATDCARYRPTFSYISIIICSVNLICTLVFSLFWYCSGVTRTLYANLSSSAFIVSSYSILVAVNLALGILLFFVNTCHFQRIIATRSNLIGSGDPLDHQPLKLYASGDGRQLAVNALLLSPNEINLLWPPSTTEMPPEVAPTHSGQLRWRRHSGVRAAQPQLQPQAPLQAPSAKPVDELLLGTRLYATASTVASGGGGDGGGSNKRQAGYSADADADADADITQPDETATSEPIDGGPSRSDAEPELPASNEHSSASASDEPPLPLPAAPTPSMSPIEAFWVYVKGRLALARRNFSRFLLHYDLKFIGALHALCAICLQYLAIKVAVVRSHFCSPVGLLAD